jgi:hypothetical protein
MWRPIAMCVAVSWMVGCGGAGDEAHDRQPDPQQQAGEEPGDAVAPMLDSKEPYWDGSPCNGSGTAVEVGGQVWFLPSECNPNYVDTGDPADKVQPPSEMGVDI